MSDEKSVLYVSGKIDLYYIQNLFSKGPNIDYLVQRYLVRTVTMNM